MKRIRIASVALACTLGAAYSACSAEGSANGPYGSTTSGAGSNATGTGTGATGGAIGVGGSIGFDGGTGTGGTTGGCSPGMVKAECANDADCDDGDPSTTDTCQIQTGGEFPSGTCLHVACDSGPSCVTQAIDPTCGTDAGVVYPPFVPLAAPDVPADCANGFQLTDANQTAPLYVIKAKTPAGSRALTLDLDFATYTAPDGLQITGVDGSCKKYVLFDSCHLKTADLPQTAYTDGMHRPSDVAIRQYHLDLRAGTSELTFDFTRVVSPMYVEVLGLCDFDITSPAAQSVKWFAPVP